MSYSNGSRTSSENFDIKENEGEYQDDSENEADPLDVSDKQHQEDVDWVDSKQFYTNEEQIIKFKDMLWNKTESAREQSASTKNQETDDLKYKLEISRSEITRLDEQVTAKDEKIATLEAAAVIAAGALENARSETESARDLAQQSAAKITRLNRQVTGKDEQIAALKADVDRWRGEVERVEFLNRTDVDTNDQIFALKSTITEIREAAAAAAETATEALNAALSEAADRLGTTEAEAEEALDLARAETDTARAEAVESARALRSDYERQVKEFTDTIKARYILELQKEKKNTENEKELECDTKLAAANEEFETVRAETVETVTRLSEAAALNSKNKAEQECEAKLVVAETKYQAKYAKLKTNFQNRMSSANDNNSSSSERIYAEHVREMETLKANHDGSIAVLNHEKTQLQSDAALYDTQLLQKTREMAVLEEQINNLKNARISEEGKLRTLNDEIITCKAEVTRLNGISASTSEPPLTPNAQPRPVPPSRPEPQLTRFDELSAEELEGFFEKSDRQESGADMTEPSLPSGNSIWRWITDGGSYEKNPQYETVIKLMKAKNTKEKKSLLWRASTIVSSSWRLRPRSSPSWLFEFNLPGSGNTSTTTDTLGGSTNGFAPSFTTMKLCDP